MNNQLAQANRKRPLSEEEGGTLRKRGRPKVSTLLERYPTLSFSEDDEEAVKRNLIKLKEECMKPNPSKTDLIPLQRSTFSSRSEFILSGLDTANDILEEHPVLHLSFAVSDYIHCIVAYFIQPCTCFFIQVEIEMDLILSQKDTFKKAMANWAKLGPAIIKYSESFSGKIGDGLKKIRDENQGMLAQILCTDR